MEKLNVIIPFLNEGEEIPATLESIRNTSGDEVEVFLIDDASTDGYDYEALARKYGAHYTLHQKRKGVAASRDEAIAACPSDYFLLLDGHMRFTSDTWSKRIIAAIASDSRAIWCTQSSVMHKDEAGNIVRPGCKTGYGAFINFDAASWHAWWNYKDPDPAALVVDIPVILGAGYACNRPYWQMLGGLEGLIVYGLDEQFISAKAWMEGGRCRLLKDIVIEHLYRQSFPYPIDDYPRIYNSLLLNELFLDDSLQEKFINRLIERNNRSTVVRAMNAIIKIEDRIKAQRDAIIQMQHRPFSDFIALNRKGENEDSKA